MGAQARKFLFPSTYRTALLSRRAPRARLLTGTSPRYRPVSQPGGPASAPPFGRPMEAWRLRLRLAPGAANGSRAARGSRGGIGIGVGVAIGIGPGRSMGGWRDMPAEALEEQYSPSRWSPRLGTDAVIQAHLAATAAGTQRARDGAQTSLHVPYGDGEGEKLDIYFPMEPSGTFPVLVYIHGGYWQCLSKEESGFMVPPLVSQGVAVVAVGYDIAPKGRMDTMVLQVRRSLAFLVEQYPGIRGIYLCGHSAGAHLAAMVLSTDWMEYGVVLDIKGAVLVSGVYDLEPILHTYVNDVLNMSWEVAQRNSPMLYIAPPGPAAAACEVLVAVAQHDSPEFRRQSQEYGQALRAAGWSVSLLDLAGMDHFDIIEKLSEDSYVLTQVILNMISRA
ncbi:kynurenine formamidase isoform X1 [Falco biarmicus]|uniref:kynurenine formamidase isoform X1 n=1 Tax=Falco cherrug TaxID=345164 RepID=UPI002478B71C|nr:kynurenine formamidase isoform X1 [Falco cherrug]XP_056190190.1 kynurenine formamidase isoform X1 [Falco biarmicus]